MVGTFLSKSWQITFILGDSSSNWASLGGFRFNLGVSLAKWAALGRYVCIIVAFIIQMAKWIDICCNLGHKRQYWHISGHNSVHF